MSNDLNNNFEKLIRSKFEDYRTPVDPGSWNLIKKSLIKSRRIRYVYIAASFVAVAAATVLLLITLNRPEINGRKDNMAEQENRIAKKPENTETQAKTQKQEVFGQIAKEAETEQEEHLLLQPVSNPVPVYNADIETLVAMNETPEPRPDDPPFKERLQIVPQNISGASISLSSPNILRLSGNNTYPSLLENRKPGSKDNKKKDNSTQDNGNDMAAIPGKNGHDDRKWSVLMSFGAGNYQPSTISNRNSDLIMAAPILTSSNSTDYIRNRYKNEIMIPDNADTQHGLPLSAKFIVRKDLNSRWAVESGLNYTYLSTKYKWNKNTAKQHLHYLGIPLNVVYYVISKSNWNVYASAGGMVEKGIYSRIDRSDMTASKTNMKGLQWSVNGSVGMTYKLSRSVGMFFEPQAGYFFDNGQPESIRSEWPVSFGLGIGLRFSF